VTTDWTGLLVLLGLCAWVAFLAWVVGRLERWNRRQLQASVDAAMPPRAASTDPTRRA
jgi:hypothetical protein